jgi:hypothetical protein
MTEPINIALTEEELRYLYAFLKKQESLLNKKLQGFLFRIEKTLYEKLTIEEIEDLRKSYEFR